MSLHTDGQDLPRLGATLAEIAAEDKHVLSTRAMERLRRPAMLNKLSAVAGARRNQQGAINQTMIAFVIPCDRPAR